MKKVLSRVCVVGFATLMTTACAFDHQTSVLVPTSAEAVNNPPPAVSGGGHSSTPSLLGTYVSASAAPTLPDPKSCGNFQYQIASQTPTSIAGYVHGPVRRRPDDLRQRIRHAQRDGRDVDGHGDGEHAGYPELSVYAHRQRHG